MPAGAFEGAALAVGQAVGGPVGLMGGAGSAAACAVLVPCVAGWAAVAVAAAHGAEETCLGPEVK